MWRGSPKSNISGTTKLSWNIMPRWKEIMHCRWSLVRGWVTGLVMGIVPAAGASVAQWIAYAWEIQRGKAGDKFGEGEVKGLAATEGSNNGVTGTSLIPMFVLGIPGGISAAVILGALMIHGLQPGERLFRDSPEVIFTVIWASSSPTSSWAGSPPMARTMAYVTLFPAVCWPRSSWSSVWSAPSPPAGKPVDVWIMVALIIGYLAHKYNFSPAGILLGIILGPIAEEGLRNVLIVSDDSPFTFIFSRWISVVIIAMIVIALYYAFKPKAWDKAVEEGEAKLAEGAVNKDD